MSLTLLKVIRKSTSVHSKLTWVYVSQYVLNAHYAQSTAIQYIVGYYNGGY